jgi:hypothetical protein
VSATRADACLSVEYSETLTSTFGGGTMVRLPF